MTQPETTGELERLSEAIDRIRNKDPWRTVTVLTPNHRAALQVRRRLAAHRGSVFNVRWVDGRQVALELEAAGGGSVRQQATRAQQLAAAWLALSREESEDLQRFIDAETMPGALVRAFDTLDSLPASERAMAGQRVAGLYGAYRDILCDFRLPSEIYEAATSALGDGEVPLEGWISYRCEDVSPMQRSLMAALTGHVKAIPSSSFMGMPMCDGYSVHDEMDEIHLATALVQDVAIDLKIAPYDMAVVIPARDPYAKLIASEFQAAGICYNGAAPQTIAETPEGVLTAQSELTATTWRALVDNIRARIETGSGDDLIKRAILDGLDLWSGPQELGATTHPALVRALLNDLLRTPVQSSARFGDGVFVGTPGQMAGLDFRLSIAVGFSAGAYPAPLRSVPFLARNIGSVSPDEQLMAWKRTLARCEHRVLIYARSDRRGEREAFPSPWMAELCDNLCEYGSPLDLVRTYGPRSATAQALAQAMAEGRSSSPGQSLAAAWNADPPPESEWRSETITDLPDKFSPTGIETFLACPRKWFYRYRMLLKEPEEPMKIGFTPADMGTVVHRALRGLFAERSEALRSPDYRWTDSDRSRLSDLLLAAATEVGRGSLTGPQRREIKRWGPKLDRVLAVDQCYRSKDRATPIVFEHELYGEVAGIAIRGVADRIDRLDDDTLVVIDYKTGRAPDTTKKSRDSGDTRKGTRLQGLLYATLAQEPSSGLEGGPFTGARGEYWYLGGSIEKMTVVQTVNDANRAELVGWLELVRDMFAGGMTPMTPARSQNKLCPYCAYRDICPGDREATALCIWDYAQAREPGDALRRFAAMKGLAGGSIPEEEQ
jgi:RecB family exonuclease